MYFTGIIFVIDIGDRLQIAVSPDTVSQRSNNPLALPYDNHVNEFMPNRLCRHQAGMPAAPYDFDLGEVPANQSGKVQSVYNLIAGGGADAYKKNILQFFYQLILRKMIDPRVNDLDVYKRQ